ncbi:hypothetical protein RR21198_3529 [Rhodococcus rhodochrous ATCC 21198]|uniref:Uncharacterized protein n=1 Tax=Rhodococcus ruber TaxID=1830 RepID=A0A098BMZ6_9NOCA|nr:hypothetical protein RR21198_3529 [Rhodococcus rhodochrous ATCC 21198]CDZ89587.1 hypothetical protein RHRU231_50009 [Rhodococcus ruber]
MTNPASTEYRHSARQPSITTNPADPEETPAGLRKPARYTGEALATVAKKIDVLRYRGSMPTLRRKNDSAG